MTRRDQRGVVLVMVLWVTALLAMIAASFVFEMRVETRMAANTVEYARATALAEAGVERGILALLVNRATPGSRPPATLEEPFGEGSFRVRLESEAGKIDLNRAPRPLIEGLALRIAGEDGGPDLAAAILDWRDPDHRRRPGGAEDGDYEALGYGAADAPFAATSELRRVRGVSDAAYRRIAPAVTVYSGRPTLNPGDASRDALLALPGATEAAVDDFIASRAAAEAEGSAPPTVITGVQARYLAVAGSTTYTVWAEGRAGRAVSVRAAVVRISPSRRQPYQVLAWVTGSAAVSAPEPEG